MIMMKFVKNGIFQNLFLGVADDATAQNEKWILLIFLLLVRRF